LSARELCLGGIDLGAKMFERFVGRGVGERVEANGQGLGFFMGMRSTSVLKTARSRLRASSCLLIFWRTNCVIAVSAR
jgi:hypothetical protein